MGDASHDNRDQEKHHYNEVMKDQSFYCIVRVSEDASGESGLMAVFGHAVINEKDGLASGATAYALNTLEPVEGASPKTVREIEKGRRTLSRIMREAAEGKFEISNLQVMDSQVLEMAAVSYKCSCLI